MPGPKSCFEIPAGHVSASLKIIDTQARITNTPVSYLMGPPLNGFDRMPTHPSWSFLIEHAPSKSRVLFDLSISTDWKNYSPSVLKLQEQFGWRLSVPYSVADVLQKHGTDLDSITHIVWSHHHWDHIGDTDQFPSSVEIVVGEGFTNEYLPGYPSNADSQMRERDVSGKRLREVSFDDKTSVGELRAYDFFGDGSFFLIDTPGHTIGHIAGLVRTTISPDTFVFLGGDLCHHAAEMRPSIQSPLPDATHLSSILSQLGMACPGSLVHSINCSRGRAADVPIFDPKLAINLQDAVATIRKVQQADARDDVLFIFAHDTALLDHVDFFPNEISNWKQANWHNQVFWGFLRDFDKAIPKLEAE